MQKAVYHNRRRGVRHQPVGGAVAGEICYNLRHESRGGAMRQMSLIEGAAADAQGRTDVPPFSSPAYTGRKAD